MIIVSAGMHRSGSTWLYNVLRYIYILDQKEVHGCFIKHYDYSRKEDIHVVKIHSFDKKLADSGNFVFLTRRDLRDIIASAIRRKLIVEDGKSVITYLNNVLYREYLPWKEYLSLEIIYENLIQNKISVIEKIIKILKVNVKSVDVFEKVEELKVTGKFNPITHLHPNHITNGEAGSYKKTLSKKTIDLINSEFKEYLLNWKYL